jgi:hypothetical protein
LRWNWNILDRFSQNSQISNFMNIRPESPSCSMQTDMTKLKVAFRNSANVSKKSLTVQGNNMFLSACSINFREILVTNGNRGCILRDKQVWGFWSVVQRQR